jgi:peptidoglycan-associated lipoprotein
MRTWSSALLIGLAAAAGCHHAPVAQAPAPTEDLAARARADSIEAEQRARADSAARAEADRLAREDAARLALVRSALGDTLTQRIHFDFDRAEIRAEDRPLLDRKLSILLANPEIVLRVAGHADERGSDEYNLALAARRAASVRAYFINHGIAADRLEVVSYGEEQPLVQEHNESAWAMNRRDEFTPQGGTGSLMPPAGTR